MAALLRSFATGTVFGTALTASSVHLPSTMLAQFNMQDSHMFRVFLMASACSTAVVYVADRTGYVKSSPRSESSYGWFGRYDANVVGGLMQGLGMVLGGACPGTLLVQMSLGIRSGWYVFLGGLAGGLAFVKLGSRLRRQFEPDEKEESQYTKGRNRSSSSDINGSSNNKKEATEGQIQTSTDTLDTRSAGSEAGIVEPAAPTALSELNMASGSVAGSESKSKPPDLTVMQKFGISSGTAVLAYEATILGAVLLSTRSQPFGLLPLSSGSTSLTSVIAWTSTNAILGGSLIGFAQLSSLILIKKTLGVSSAYQELAVWFVKLLDSTQPSPSLTATALGLGIMAGARFVNQFYVAGDVFRPSEQGAITPLGAVLGGFFGIFGARLAGGCTSGHVISGTSTLSLSSFVTVAAIIGGGTVFGLVLR